MPLSVGTFLPPLDGLTEWINQPANVGTLLNRPILMQFWAMSCPVCKDNIPKIQQLLEIYQDQGLELISVHMPRSEADTNVDKVKAVVQELGLSSPCAIDNEHILGDRFQTGGVWPVYFLFDGEGRLRSRAAGQLGIEVANNSLKRLLGLGMS